MSKKEKRFRLEDLNVKQRGWLIKLIAAGTITVTAAGGGVYVATRNDPEPVETIVQGTIETCVIQFPVNEEPNPMDLGDGTTVNVTPKLVKVRLDNGDLIETEVDFGLVGERVEARLIDGEFESLIPRDDPEVKAAIRQLMQEIRLAKDD